MGLNVRATNKDSSFEIEIVANRIIPETSFTLFETHMNHQWVQYKLSELAEVCKPRSERSEPVDSQKCHEGILNVQLTRRDWIE